MTQQFFNNFDTTLSVQVEIVDLTMTVDDATGLPVTLGGGNSYLLTLSDGPVETLWEIVLVTTDRAGNVITMARAQEGSTALVWPIGTFVSARVTAETMDAAIGGGGGGGSGTELVYARNLHWMTIHNSEQGNQGALYFSKDGGYSWNGDRQFNLLGLAGGDIEDPVFAIGSGINCPGLTISGISFE
jgi:hypothetical protein